MPDQTRKKDAFEVAREALIDRYGTADPARLRRQGRGDETELGAADSIARRAVESLTVFRDYRWGTDCPVHLLRHWCTPCRGEDGHDGPHTCACGATDAA